MRHWSRLAVLCIRHHSDLQTLNHSTLIDWLSSVIHPLQHSIGYMGDGFYRSKDPTNSIKVLKEKAERKNNTKNIKKTENTHTQNSIQITVTQTNTASPLVYNNMGWLGDSSHRGQGRYAWTAVVLPPRDPLNHSTRTLPTKQPLTCLLQYWHVSVIVLWQ